MTQMWLCNPAKRLYFFRCRSLSLKGSCHEYFAVLQCRSILCLSHNLLLLLIHRVLLYSKEEDIKQYFLAIFALIHVHHSIRSSRRQETVSVPSVFNNKIGPLFLNSIDVMNFLALKKIVKTVP